MTSRRTSRGAALCATGVLYPKSLVLPGLDINDPRPFEPTGRRVVTAAASKRGQKRESLFASSAHSVAGLGSTAYAMRQAARSRPPPSCARRPVSLVRRARPTATTCNCRRCSFTRSGVILHLLMQRQWPCKFLVLAALSAMWGVRRTHWLAQLLPVEEEMSNSF